MLGREAAAPPVSGTTRSEPVLVVVTSVSPTRTSSLPRTSGPGSSSTVTVAPARRIASAPSPSSENTRPSAVRSSGAVA